MADYLPFRAARYADLDRVTREAAESFADGLWRRILAATPIRAIR
jgi:hypothetical protein